MGYSQFLYTHRNYLLSRVKGGIVIMSRSRICVSWNWTFQGFRQKLIVFEMWWLGLASNRISGTSLIKSDCNNLCFTLFAQRKLTTDKHTLDLSLRIVEDFFYLQDTGTNLDSYLALYFISFWSYVFCVVSLSILFRRPNSNPLYSRSTRFSIVSTASEDNRW